MTTARQIEAYLEQFAPKRLKMDFDNVGFLIGDGDAPVERILVSLDITPSVVDEASRLGAGCIVTHHPVIFRAIKSVTDNDPHGRMLMKMLREGIAAVCMHTNLDLAPDGVNQMLALRLGLSDIEIFTQRQLDSVLGPIGLGRTGNLRKPMEPEELCRHVRVCLGCNGVRFVSGGGLIERIAVAGGHCGDLLHDAREAGCRAYVTSDISYDEFLDAKALGMTLIDAGHYPTENVVVPQLHEWLQKGFPRSDVHISKVHSEVIEFL